MKSIIIYILFSFPFINGLSLDDSDSILEEGKLLYKLEKASWYGTDDFIKRFPHKMTSIGGYLSYRNDDDYIINLFYSNEDPNEIIVRYYFDKYPQSSPINIDTLNTEATKMESDLISLRTKAAKRVSSNENEFYSFYQNTSLNFIPLIINDQRRVFILTGPRVGNVVLLGNDYLLTFDDNNQLVEEKKLHNTILQFPYTSGDPENKITFTNHSHVVTDKITSTDICTLLLYRELVEWNQHIVISEKYVSIFNMAEKSLLIMTREAWERINEHQQNRDMD